MIWQRCLGHALAHHRRAALLTIHSGTAPPQVIALPVSTAAPANNPVEHSLVFSNISNLTPELINQQPVGCMTTNVLTNDSRNGTYRQMVPDFISAWLRRQPLRSAPEVRQHQRRLVASTRCSPATTSTTTSMATSAHRHLPPISARTKPASPPHSPQLPAPNVYIFNAPEAPRRLGLTIFSTPRRKGVRVRGAPAVQRCSPRALLAWAGKHRLRTCRIVARPDDVNIVGASYPDRGEAADSEADCSASRCRLAQDGARAPAIQIRRSGGVRLLPTPAAPPVN